MNSAESFSKATQGENDMVELKSGNTLEINLKQDAQGRDCVVLALPAHGCSLDLSPHQARVLATELIMAVNRAEVRSNLMHNQNSLERGSQPAERKGGLFNQAFAK
jgi:hypothetical protein